MVSHLSANNGILPSAKTRPKRHFAKAKVGKRKPKGLLCRFLQTQKPGNAGWSSPVARQAHNLKAAGSNPAPATKKTPNTFQKAGHQVVASGSKELLLHHIKNFHGCHDIGKVTMHLQARWLVARCLGGHHRLNEIPHDRHQTLLGVFVGIATGKEQQIADGDLCVGRRLYAFLSRSRKP